MKRNDTGFTLIELAFVTSISVVFASVAVIQLRPTRAVLEAQSVSNLVISQMNYGRQVAIDERRISRIGKIARQIEQGAFRVVERRGHDQLGDFGVGFLAVWHGGAR